jgi:hypothetical protein
LDGTKYRLNYNPFSLSEKVYDSSRPPVEILALKELKVGTRFWVDDRNKVNKEEKELLKEDSLWGDEYLEMVGRFFRVVEISEVGNEVIIYAVGSLFKHPEKKIGERKAEALRTIVPQIDFGNEILRDRIVEILSLVFLPEQLEEMLKEDAIEILMFNGFMYLKVGDKAYRL